VKATFSGTPISAYASRLIEAEREALGHGGKQDSKRRGIAFTKGTSRGDGAILRGEWRPDRYEDFAGYTAKVEETVSYNYRVSGPQESFGEPGSGGAVRAQHPPRLRSQGNGP